MFVNYGFVSLFGIILKDVFYYWGFCLYMCYFFFLLETEEILTYEEVEIYYL